MTDRPAPNPRPLRLGHARRLHGRRAFAAVHEARTRHQSGPLSFSTLPNALGHWRLGLSVPRAVGTAVRRSRVKRMLREAFRLSQHELPGGYDVVIHARPHRSAKLEEYRSWLLAAARVLDERWTQRERQRAARGETTSGAEGPSGEGSTRRRPA